MKCFSMLLTGALVLAVSTVAVAQGVTKYVRYEYNGTVSYGILEGETIYQLRGNIFESPSRDEASPGFMSPREPTIIQEQQAFFLQQQKMCVG